MPAADKGKFFAGAGDGGVEQGAVEAFGIGGRQQPNVAVFGALAFVYGHGEGGFVGGQAAEGDFAVCAAVGEIGRQRAVAAVGIAQDQADVAVEEAERVVVAFYHDDLSGKPLCIRRYAPVPLQVVAAGEVEAGGIVAPCRQYGQMALTVEGGRDVGMVGGLPVVCLLAVEVGGQLFDGCRADGQLVGETVKLRPSGFIVSGAHRARQTAQPAVFAETVADGQAGGVGRKRGRV